MKKCLQCQGEVPEKATKCMHCGSKIRLRWQDMSLFQKISSLGCLTLIIWIVVIGFTSYGIGNKTNTAPTKNISYNTPSLGEKGIIKIDAKQWFLAIDENAYKEMEKSIWANDTLGLLDLTAKGKLFYVSNGIKVQVIEIGLERQKVRVLEGEQFGKAGWINYKFITK